MFKLSKISSLVVAVLLLLVGGVQAAETRIWQGAASQGFQSFYQAMETNGWVVPEAGINVNGLAVLAYDHAKSKNLVSASEKESFVKLFRQRNGLKGEYIAVETFRTTGVGNGFFIGSLADMQQAVNGTAVSSVTAPANSEAALQQLKDEVVALTTKEKKSYQDVIVLKSKLEALNAGLKAQNESNALFQAKTDRSIKDVTQRIVTFEKNVEKVIETKVATKVDEGLEPLKVANVGFSERLAELQNSFKSLVKQGKKVDELAAVVGRTTYATAVGFVLLAIALVFLAFKFGTLSKKVKKHENTIFGVGNTKGIAQKVGALQAEVDHHGRSQEQLNDRVVVVEEQAGGKVEYDEVTLASIVEQVKQLNENEMGSFESAFTVEKMIYTLRFTFVEKGYVMIEGVKDQTRPVQIGKIRSVLLRAAGARRIIGIGKAFSLEDDDTVVIPLANVTLVEAEGEPRVLHSRRAAAA